MMTFKVAAANGAVTNYTGDYRITEAAVLVIHPKDGNPVLYSPVGWMAVELVDAPKGMTFDRMGYTFERK